MSHSIETVLIVLLLATRAAAHNRMSGHVTQIDTAGICIRARFPPRVPFLRSLRRRCFIAAMNEYPQTFCESATR